MRLIEALNWRYATKKYNDTRVSEENIEQIVQAINLSASSTGLQPYRLYIIENETLRAQLGEDSFNNQIINSSHLLVFAAFNDVTNKHIDDYMQRVASERKIPLDTLNEFKAGLANFFLNNTSEENTQWAIKQAYIGLGTALIAAAELKIDATPMEGFDPKKFDKLLGLKEKGLTTAVIMSIGYRDEEKDSIINLKKVRLPLAEFVTKID
ncbi:NAD(P)H-dependent oxidoreductase [Autumnicola musiva]|uniref:NAD(P)H-dependent oxidoreductase n=1 Tax=Autumnicola musiva TaxID=3075589 RepID=A0ABU3D8T8_9FLAO|nr:NAD(P)H-dependent oxidoreductase [Zunongwangia sp. F117]MDT0677934.1 NAD(P)H-dependent oxidoreductase [Zunongwangia sp. F117]